MTLLILLFAIKQFAQLSIFKYIFLNFLPIFFLIFHNIVMIYNTRNRSNDTTETQTEKMACFNAHAAGK